MTLELVPFKAEHALELDLQPSQRAWRAVMSIEGLRTLEHPDSHTILQDGVPVVCTGVLPLWENRAMVWAFLGAVATTNFVKVHNICKRIIYASSYRRIESYVECDFEPGHRWNAALGFTLELPRMRAFQADGKDCALYSIVRM